MTAEQLSLHDVLDQPPPGDLWRSPGPVLAHGGTGADRLMRKLVRRGLEPDAWPVAARLVAELDREAPKS